MKTLIEILKASGAVTAGSITGSAVQLQKVYREAVAILNVTAAATEVDDTLDVFIDTSYDGGTTWVNIGAFTQSLGNGGARVLALNFAADNATAVLDVEADLAAGNIRALPIGGQIRYRSTVVDAGGSAASFTFDLKIYLKE